MRAQKREKIARAGEVCDKEYCKKSCLGFYDDMFGYSTERLQKDGPSASRKRKLYGPEW